MHEASSHEWIFDLKHDESAEYVYIRNARNAKKKAINVSKKKFKSINACAHPKGSCRPIGEPIT